MKKTSEVNAARRVTLNEVAKDSGVSRSTASLVIRGSSLVSRDTAWKVHQSIEKLGYVYNRSAAYLRTRRSNTIGMIVSDIMNPFFTEMTVSAESELDRAQKTVMLANTSESIERQQRALEGMLEHNVDGLLLCPATGTERRHLEPIIERRVPLVLFTRFPSGLITDYVGADNVLGAELATRRLIEHGHRRISFIGGPENASARHERIQGFRRAMEAYGLPIDDRLLPATPVTRSGGYHAVRALLALHDPPTATICHCDNVALGVMLGVESLGMRPGPDFGVIGFDDIDEAALWTPSLSTVSITPQRMGREAVRLLLRKMDSSGEELQRIFLTPKLVIRESCGTGPSDTE